MPAPADAVRQAPSGGDATPARGSRLARGVDAVLQAWKTDSEDALLALQVMIGRALAAGADFSRAESAWPGGAGYGLARGTAGIVHTLRECSLDVDPLAEEWLADATAPGGPPGPAGLYDGLAGVAWLYRRQGRDELADELLECVLSTDLERLGTDLYSGLPGIGLFLLSETGRAPVLLGNVDHLGRTLQARRAGGTARPAGLLDGEAGIALFWLRLYGQTSEPSHLDLARGSLDAAIAGCRWDEDGSLLAPDPDGRPGAGLARGASGIGLVLTEYLRSAPDRERYLPVLDGFRTAACRQPVDSLGVSDGLAGVVHFLVALVRAGFGTEEVDAALEARVNAFAGHAVRLGTGIAFRGPAGLSYDLATGAAGVLGALQAYGLARFDDSREGWDGLLPLLLG